jgi:cytoskeletal protein CcmA (bactofilin family)
MFSKSDKGAKKRSKQSDSPTKPSPPSIISADLRVVGDLHSDGEIHVDGSVDGNIRTTNLLVGESATIKGEIVSDAVNVHGTVTGQIKSSTVTLSRTAHVTGDILHENLAIEKGAFLEGHCKRMDARQEPSGKINLVVKEGEGEVTRPGIDPKKAAVPT